MKWIDVKDRLPEIIAVDNRLEIGETIFALDEDGFRYIGHFERFKYDGSYIFCGIEIDEYYVNTTTETIDSIKITHWMPLPEPPKEENNETI